MVKRWYKPKTSSGWHKSQTPTYRRKLVLKAHKSYLSAGRSMQALANVTQDRATERAARADAKYFFAKNRKSR